MKTSMVIAALTLASFADATSASAYHLNPPDASVRLHGKMTFTPNEGGSPFTCTVTIDLKTKRNRITDMIFPRGICDVHFNDLPWAVVIIDENSGEIVNNGFSSGHGLCDQNATKFQDDGSGIWTFPVGQCLSGTLKSNPPTTIVP